MNALYSLVLQFALSSTLCSWLDDVASSTLSLASDTLLAAWSLSPDAFASYGVLGFLGLVLSHAHQPHRLVFEFVRFADDLVLNVLRLRSSTAFFILVALSIVLYLSSLDLPVVACERLLQFPRICSGYVGFGVGDNTGRASRGDLLQRLFRSCQTLLHLLLMVRGWGGEGVRGWGGEGVRGWGGEGERGRGGEGENLVLLYLARLARLLRSSINLNSFCYLSAKWGRRSISSSPREGRSDLVIC